MNALHDIQTKLKVGKENTNTFGKYNYRNCSDILEAVKPLLPEGFSLLLSDEIVLIGERYYVKATAILSNGKESSVVTAFARESFDKKGMDDSQITGAASSYARKYALNGLFAIDDTKDADSMDNTDHKTAPKAVAKSHNNVNEIFEVAIKAISNAMDAESLKSHYEAAKTMCSNQPEADRVMKVRNDRAKMLREMEDTGKHDDAGDRV
jgi:hypothetical protein